MRQAKYEITLSAFHGGRHVSYHRTLEAAVKAQRKYKTDCTCGCLVIGYTDNERNTGPDWASLQHDISFAQSQFATN